MDYLSLVQGLEALHTLIENAPHLLFFHGFALFFEFVNNRLKVASVSELHHNT
jgi:hypothetical protein